MIKISNLCWDICHLSSYDKSTLWQGSSHAYYAYNVWKEGGVIYSLTHLVGCLFVAGIQPCKAREHGQSCYRRRSQKWYSINCGQDGHMYKTNIRTCIHLFYILPYWCVLLNHKINCLPNFYAHIELRYVLSIPTVHFESKNLTLR